MARVVRKVSNKAVRGQKKGLLYSKKFWISTVAAVVAVVAIVLGLVFGLGLNKTEEPKVEDYFGMEYTINPAEQDNFDFPVFLDENKDLNFKKDEDGNSIFNVFPTAKPADKVTVKFTKATYAEAVMRTNDNNVNLYNEHTFVFATDLSTFYPRDIMDGDEVVKEKNKDHEKILNALILLQAEIDNYNKYFQVEGKPSPAKLLIIDTKEAAGSTNASILGDTSFGGAEGTTLLLSLVSNEELVKDFTDVVSNKTKTVLCTNYTASAVQGSVNASRSFIRQRFMDASK